MTKDIFWMVSCISEMCIKFSRNMLNFTQQFEAPLSQRQKTFSGCFLAFLKCALNLEHFEKKDQYSSLVISKVIDSERGGYLNV